jgi:DNA-binding transcriptional ArsR family regulator
MSFQMMAWAVAQTTGSPTRKAVLLALANRVNHDTGRCFPSIERLVEETELSDRTVRRALDDLEEAGFIERTRQRHPDGNFGGYEYRLLTSGQSDRSPPDTVTGQNQEEHQPGRSSEVLVANAPRTSAQQIVSDYVDLVREEGVDPPRRIVGIVAQRTKQLLDEGQEPEAIRGALRLMIERRLHPSTLDSLILEAAAGPGRRQRQLSPLEADYEKLKRGEL